MCDKNSNPCHYCQNRHANCHAECDSYNNWLAEYSAEQERLREKHFLKHIGDKHSKSTKRN